MVQEHSVNVNCPFCEKINEIKCRGEGIGKSLECTHCGRIYVAKPEGDGAKGYKPHELDCCDDPQCRETEMAAGDD